MNRFNSENKQHYKMYKAGKKWICAAITTIAVIAGTATFAVSTVKADTTEPATVTAPVSEPSDTPSAVVASNPTTVTGNISNKTENIGSDATNTKKVATTELNNNNDSLTDNNKTSNPTDSSDINHTKSNNDDVSSTISKDASNHTTNPVENKQTAVTTNFITEKTTDNSETAAVNDSHVQKRDGKTYFIGDDGEPKKNFTAIIDGKNYYFSKDTGELQSSDNQYSDSLESVGNPHNAAFAYDEKNFTNVDGFLTANSWYRPVDILKDGQDWTPSTENDYRPLLMAWWPDKGTQVQYLEYMRNVGMLPEKDIDLSNVSQKFLDIASLVVQSNIEKQITERGNVDWLRENINKFVNSQPQWNIGSEEANGDHFQGGALLYVNSELTPYANSDYRLINRMPAHQNGGQPENGDGYELLLANDIDNSNPAVQAEQLNWLYYMMNIGTITANDPNGNFDGYRVDAVDNVDADLLQIAGDYFKAAYGIDKSDANANSHLSILEDWSLKDPEYVKEHGNEQLTMDFSGHISLLYSLGLQEYQRNGLQQIITGSLVSRGEDYTSNVQQPNYSFIRAHDSGVQEIIARIITERINPNANGFIPTQDELAEAFKIYDEDENKIGKEYTMYNLPAIYALLLTNKDTVPRVYYGDLYTDDGQYMATKTPYYDAITTLLQGRVKYVAGGQKMDIQHIQGDHMPDYGSKEILTSVRYGKDAVDGNAIGNDETRTEGLGVIVSNNSNLKLSSTDRITLNMGAAHRNQAYRALMLTTRDGLQTYNSDNAPTVYTNDLGQLIFGSDMIFGASFPEVSGYVAVWVPVGAPINQDARTASSDAPTNDGYAYHSNAALDSQLIYEGFSNFTAMPTQPDEYANVKIAQNAAFFKSLGVTSFELAPQYRSSTDSTFVDSIIKNGYSFTDRYDVGYGTPTKYGTVEQLVDCLKALHAQGIQAIDDWVPDQIYNLPGEEVVKVKRTDSSGNLVAGTKMDGILYDSHTVGGGKYQAMYGGAFLDKLKEMYPELFKVNQISTGKPMNPDEKITEWSAKYMNGSNIQGRGTGYVLKDDATNQYFNVSDDKNNLPKLTLGDRPDSGFVKVNGNTQYYSDNGNQAKETFIKDNGNLYYFDGNGNMVTGLKTIDNNLYDFNDQGVAQSDVVKIDNTYYYFDHETHAAVKNDYVQSQWGDWYMFGNDGKIVSGIYRWAGTYYYFDPVTYLRVTNDYVQSQWGDWYMFGNDGKIVSGVYQWAGTYYYFDPVTYLRVTNDYVQSQWGDWYMFGNDGKIVSGVYQWAGTYYYFDPVTYLRVNNDYVQSQWGDWYMFGNDGKIVSGVYQWAGTYYYFDPVTYLRVTNDYVQSQWGDWYMFGNDGKIVSGVYQWAGTYYYFDPVTYLRVTNDYVQSQWGDWYMFGNDGKIVSGLVDWNGSKYYFDPVTYLKAINTWKNIGFGWGYFNQNGQMTMFSNY